MRIDYRELKRSIQLLELLESIGWTSTEGRGKQLRGPCPLPACVAKVASTANGKTRLFSMHAGKNIYRCFGCGSSGNALDFWQAYCGKSLRESAIELAKYSETSNRTDTINQPLNTKISPSHLAKMADS